MHPSGVVILAILAVAVQISCVPVQTGSMITRKLKQLLEGTGEPLSRAGPSKHDQAELVPMTRANDVQIQVTLYDMESISGHLARIDDALLNKRSIGRLQLGMAPIESYLIIWDELARLKLDRDCELAEKVSKFLANPRNRAVAERLRKIYAAHLRIRDDFAHLIRVYEGFKPQSDTTYEEIKQKMDESIELMRNLDPAWDMSARAPKMLKQLLEARQHLTTMNDFINDARGFW